MYIKTDEDGNIQALLHNLADTEEPSAYELLVSYPEDLLSTAGTLTYNGGVFTLKPPVQETN
mgnify:CR=1 FL=1|tara:strand:- start:2365 stop:2550 length:186 start_codon:yes stop_codon:yes gene_type:complete